MVRAARRWSGCGEVEASLRTTRGLPHHSHESRTSATPRPRGSRKTQHPAVAVSNASRSNGNPRLAGQLTPGGACLTSAGARPLLLPCNACPTWAQRLLRLPSSVACRGTEHAKIGTYEARRPSVRAQVPITTCEVLASSCSDAAPGDIRKLLERGRASTVTDPPEVADRHQRTPHHNRPYVKRARRGGPAAR